MLEPTRRNPDVAYLRPNIFKVLSAYKGVLNSPSDRMLERITTDILEEVIKDKHWINTNEKD